MKKEYLFLLFLLVFVACKEPYNIRSLRNGYNKLRPATLDPDDKKLAATSILKKRNDFKSANFYFERRYSAELVVLAGDSIHYSMGGTTEDKWTYSHSDLNVSGYTIPCKQQEGGHYFLSVSSSDQNGKNMIRSIFGNAHVFTFLTGNDTVFSKTITAYQPLDILSPKVEGYNRKLKYSDVIRWNRDTTNHDGVEIGITCYQGSEIIESFHYITEDIGSLMLYHIYDKLPRQTTGIYVSLCRSKLIFAKGKDKKTYKICIESRASTGYDL
jgi:hypothetical protein